MNKFKFEGNALEYFKIWIVNILLTIITLGIYYPWAKVRSNIYFYKNTKILDKNFNYLATGKQLFLGYLIAICILAIYLIMDIIVPQFNFIFAILLFIAIPWIIWRSIKFNMRVTSFNNVKFKFDGKLSTVYLIYFIYPLALFISIGLIIGIAFGIKSLWSIILSLLLIPILLVVGLSFLEVKKHSYLFNFLEYGQSKFNIDLKTRIFIKILFKTLIVAIATFVGLCLLMYLINYTSIMQITEQLNNMGGSGSMDKGFLVEQLKSFIPQLILFYILGIIANFVVYAYYQTRVREYVYSNLVLNNNITFTSTLKFLKLTYIIITNILVIIITLGLAIPWSKVRLTRYMLENTLISSNIDLNIFLNEQTTKESAIGEEIGDVLDIDTGIVI